MKRSIQITATVLAILFLVFCRRAEKQSEPPDPAYSQYVSSFTTGTISCRAPIQVELAQEPKPAGTQGADVPGKVISLEPNVKGKVQWVNSRTMAFVPEEKMKAGKSYTVTVALDQFMDVPKKFALMKFQVRIISQSFHVSDLAVKAYDYGTKKDQYLTGTL